MPEEKTQPAINDVTFRQGVKIDTPVVFGSLEEKRKAYIDFVSGMIKLQPIEDWQTVLYPLAKKWNTTSEPVLPEEEASEIYGSICADEREVRIEAELESEEGQIRKEYSKDKTTATFMLAEYLNKKFSVITVGEKEMEMFVYRDGMYVPFGENEIIYPEIQRILGAKTNKNAKNETFHKLAHMTFHPRTVFTSAPIELIPLKNGVYNRLTRRLQPHSPEYRFTYQFPIVYDPKATCPKVSSYIEQVFTEKQRPIIQEWLGYYFHRQYSFKKAIIFVGEGDTGKTTFLETIMHLLGASNVSSVSLQKMTGDKFSAAHLYGKHGNLVDELSAKDISDTGAFKMATGNGSIMGEYKFGNQFSFKNFSKFTFACNRIPDVKDFNDEAYFNRWIVIRFENTIEKKIPNFIEQLTTEEERSGMFNLAMEGLDRLLAQGKFSYDSTGMDTKNEMMKSGSSIAMFCSEGVVEEIGAEVTKEDMYDAYSEYCQANGLATESMKMLGTKFLFYATYATEGLITVLGRTGKADRARGWRNVKPKKAVEALEKAVQDMNQFDV